MNGLLCSSEAAEHLGYSVHSLQLWRCKGSGPVYIKLNGRTVRYRRSDLDEWVGRFGKQRHTSENPSIPEKIKPFRIRLTPKDEKYLDRICGKCHN